MPAKDALERMHIAEAIVVQLMQDGDTARDLLERIRFVIERFTGMTEHAVCRNCRKEITQLTEDSQWLHTDQDRSRGCRAASFDGNDWNHELSRNAVARP